MEENVLNCKPKWDLVEKIAMAVYHNDIEIMTADDIKEIEESIDKGAPINETDSDAGEMNLETEIFNMVGAGLSAISLIVSILAWKYPNKTITHKNDISPSPTDSSDIENIDSLKVQKIIDLILNNERIQRIVKEEIKKHRESIISAIQSQLRLVTQKNESTSEK